MNKGRLFATLSIFLVLAIAIVLSFKIETKADNVFGGKI